MSRTQGDLTGKEYLSKASMARRRKTPQPKLPHLFDVFIDSSCYGIFAADWIAK
jgi:hypothetical protein